MENRSVGKFIVFSILTLGIYTLVWFFWTTKELKNMGADLPTAWLMIIPIANLFFLWKYFEQAERVTGGAVNGVLYFVLAFFVSPIISAALAQNEYNKMAGPAPAAAGMPAAQGMPQQPMQQPAPAPAPDPNQPQDPNQQPPAAPPTV